MKVVAIIQARLGSTRLPGKVLMDIAGRPMLDHVIERAQAIKGVDRVAVNMPAANLPEVKQFEWFANHVHGVANQEADVLGSYLTVAAREGADVVMRLTGDCPLLDDFLCEAVLKLWLKLGDPFAYCANDTTRSGFPDGTDCEVFSIQALTLAAGKATAPFDREHVTVWLRRHLPTYGILSGYGVDLSKRKWSVDTDRDLARVRRIYADLPEGEFEYQMTAAVEDGLL